jgi:ATP-binding protein involved in chromosome partitioning
MSIQQQDILRAAQTFVDPNTGLDYVTADQIKNLQVSDGDVSFDVALGYPGQSQVPALRKGLVAAIKTVPGVSNVSANFATHILSHAASHNAAIPGVKNIIAVASGKGGVGKSTTAVNLALALAAEGARVGVLDADIYGPSQPLMLNVTGRPQTVDGKTMEPLHNYGIQVNSIGFLVTPDQAMIWRGPMATQALDQLMRQTHWRDLDYLVVDLPPGTGDIQLSLCQRSPVTGAVIVTTPQDMALADVRKAVTMFEKVDVPILGLVENMAVFVCPNCGHEEHIFGADGGKRYAEEKRLDYLGALPLSLAIRENTDAGKPPVVSDPDGKIAATYKSIARQVAIKIAKMIKAAPAKSTMFSVSKDT